MAYLKRGIISNDPPLLFETSTDKKEWELDSYHKHRHREKVRNGIMIALAIILVLLNLWVYVMD